MNAFENNRYCFECNKPLSGYEECPHSTVERLGVDRHHPDFIKARRLRFCKLLREAKRVLNFSDEERAAVIALCKMIEGNTK